MTFCCCHTRSPAPGLPRRSPLLRTARQLPNLLRAAPTPLWPYFPFCLHLSSHAAHGPSDNLVYSPAGEYNLSPSTFPELSHPVLPLPLPGLPSLPFLSLIPTCFSNLAQMRPSFESFLKACFPHIKSCTLEPFTRRSIAYYLIPKRHHFPWSH